MCFYVILECIWICLVICLCMIILLCMYYIKWYVFNNNCVCICLYVVYVIYVLVKLINIFCGLCVLIDVLQCTNWTLPILGGTMMTVKFPMTCFTFFSIITILPFFHTFPIWTTDTLHTLPTH